jgi:uncharacterized protein YlzI (FlbEa/FlbD family)
MITLTDVGMGVGEEPLEIDPGQIASVAPLPFEPDGEGSIVTLSNGVWYRVQESVEEVNQMITDAKKG